MRGDNLLFTEWVAVTAPSPVISISLRTIKKPNEPTTTTKSRKKYVYHSFLLIGVIRFKSSGVVHAVRLLFAPLSALVIPYSIIRYVFWLCSLVRRFSHRSSPLSACPPPSTSLSFWNL